MKYLELDALSNIERKKALERLSVDELADLLDERPYEIAPFAPREGRYYFDTIEELHEHMLHNYFPEAKPWMADEAASHELAHARCALKVGACGVKYYALDRIDSETRTGIFAQIIGPATVTRLAMAAIAAHPFTSGRSLADTGVIRSLGYQSRQHVRERIVRWNEQSDLQMPMPETSPSPYFDERK